MTSVPKRDGHVIASAIARCRSGFLNAGVVSLVLNLLMLTGPFYMLQVYDRVLAAHSIPTLVAMSLLALLLLSGYGALDLIRTRLMGRMGNVLDLKLADMAFETQANSLHAKSEAGRDALRDLGVVRQFLAGPAASGLMDVPWMPIYVGIVYLLHPVLGVMAIAASIVFIMIAALNEWTSKPLAREADGLRQQESTHIADVRTNIDSVRAMGMTGSLKDLWSATHASLLDASQSASDRNTNYSVLSKTLRLILQSSILGVGAYLVLLNELSGGALIAASIIFARALAPIDQAVAQWRTILATRRSWSNLKQAAAAYVPPAQPMPLQAARSTLDVRDLAVNTADGKHQILQPISFNAVAGDGVGLIGPSGAGKTTLLRALVGAMLPSGGEIRLDGATLDQWSESARGAQIGYLSQYVQLLDGTLAQNISRFRASADPEAIVAAAKMAGVHDLILSFPAGYETRVGSASVMLSAGQKQRVGLARAVFGKPFLVVLDEPNAHLDTAGEAALLGALRQLKAAGSIIIVAAHRSKVLDEVNKVLLVQNGRAEAFGDKDEVLNSLIAKSRQQQTERGLHVVGA